MAHRAPGTPLSPRRYVAACLFGILALGAATATTGRREPGGPSSASPPRGGAERVPVIWRDPGDISTRDLFWGAGSAERAPAPPFTFVKEDSSGTKPKIQVKDAKGTLWSVKFDRRSARGREVPAEVAASRIVWAFGYPVEESYLVTEGVIEGVTELRRARRVIGPDGRFKIARFERRPAEVKRLDTRWTVADNPFAGTQELSGLLILMAALNNWDFRAGNTTVLRTPTDNGSEDLYVVSDLGTAFGRMSNRRSRWKLRHYQTDPPFVTALDTETLVLNLRPDGGEPVQIPRAHAEWFARLASGLTEPQLRRAFEAAGASDEEAAGFTSRFLAKLDELRAVSRTPRS